MSTEKRPPRIARRLNTAMVKIAGRRFFPVWAVVQHRGRKSGKPYKTPIAITSSTSGNVYITLPWGSGTDWVRNLQAADEGELVWKGQVFAVTEPRVVDKAEALDALHGMRRRLFGRLVSGNCLRLRLQPRP